MTPLFYKARLIFWSAVAIVFVVLPFGFSGGFALSMLSALMI